MFLGVLSVYAQGSRSIQTGEQKSKPFTLVEPIDFIQQWMRQNRSVILIKEIDDVFTEMVFVAMVQRD